MEKLRWGILGTADIARQNWRAIYNSGNSVVGAVASRGMDRSKQFIQLCQRAIPFEQKPMPYGSYREVLDSKVIDAVYIPIPTGLRKEWVLQAAEAGKHVLCEKPCGINNQDVREMVNACKKNNVQFMDGVMFMHNPRLKRMREVLDDGQSIGQIKRISSMFSFYASEEYRSTNIRMHSELEPAGCLGDLGWYNIRFTLWAMNMQLPKSVFGNILSQRKSNSSPAPTPSDFSGELIFDDETSAEFFCSFLTPPQQLVYVSGEKGFLYVDDFVHPANVHVPAFEVNRSPIRVKCCNCYGWHTKSRTEAQDTLMIRNFVNQVRSGKLNEEWPMMSMQTQKVLDACYESALQGGTIVQLYEK